MSADLDPRPIFVTHRMSHRASIQSPPRVSATRLLLTAWLLVMGALSVACSPIVRPAQPVQNESTPLSAGHSLGQTFSSRYRGLSGIVVHLSPGTSGVNHPASGEVRLTLHPASNQNGPPLAAVSLNMEGVPKPGYYAFHFPALAGSSQEAYYLRLESDTPLAVASGPAQAYLDGSLYRDDQPADSQLVFRLKYEPGWLMWGVFLDVLQWMLYLALAGFLFILPGWGLLALWHPAWNSAAEKPSELPAGSTRISPPAERAPGPPFWSKLALAAGVSAAIYPVLFLISDLVGLHLGLLYAWLPPAAGLLAMLRSPGARKWLASRQKIDWPRPAAADAAMLIILAAIVGTRLWPLRNLAYPMWGDSYQHTMITQLLVERGGLFQSWQPYAGLTTFTYHFGFHTLAAVFHWLSGLPAQESVLWVGQILNILAVLAVYPLAMRITPHRWAGVAAVAVAGLLSPMPHFYLNWGRYTQLTGLLILPAAVLMLWDLLGTPRLNWGLLGLVWLAYTGLALAHYRVLIFAGVFVIIYLLVSLRRSNGRNLIWRAILAGAGAFLLFLPWFLRAFRGQILTILGFQLSQPASQATGTQAEFTALTSNLAGYLPAVLWFLLAMALAWGLWRRSKETLIVMLWWVAIMLTANPGWLNLPGAGAITNFAVIISLYLPAGVVLGAATGWMVEVGQGSGMARMLSDRVVGGTHGYTSLLRPILLLVLMAGIAVASLTAAKARLGEIDPGSYALVTEPDQRAASWIRDHTPQDALFLVNTFFAYNNYLVVGADGGWWLPIMADRQTNLPPINYGNEAGPTPEFRTYVNQLSADVLAKGLSDPGVLRLLEERGITHIYIGQQQGNVNNPGPKLEAGEILDNPHFRLIYHQDRVWIFERIPPEA